MITATELHSLGFTFRGQNSFSGRDYWGYGKSKQTYEDSYNDFIEYTPSDSDARVYTGMMAVTRTCPDIDTLKRFISAAEFMFL